MPKEYETDACELHEVVFLRGSRCPVCEAEEKHAREIAILETRIEQLTATNEELRNANLSRL